MKFLIEVIYQESLMLILMSFYLEDLFNLEEKNHFETIDNNFDKYIFSGYILKQIQNHILVYLKLNQIWLIMMIMKIL